MTKEQKVLLALIAAVWAGVYIAPFSLAVSLVLLISAISLNVWLILQHVEITVFGFTVGKLK